MTMTPARVATRAGVCAQDGYDRDMTDPTDCSRPVADLSWPSALCWRWLRCTLFAGACAGGLAACGAKDSEAADTNKMDAGTLAHEEALGDLTVRVVWTDDQSAQRIELVRDGQTLWSRAGHRLALAIAFPDDRTAGVYTQGDDATGDGTANAIVRDWTGQTDCCATFIVLALGESATVVATIEAGRGGGFIDLDGDGVLEFDGHDWTWSSWEPARDAPPAPRIVLRFREGRYELAPDLMTTDDPTEDELESILEEVMASDSWERGAAPAILWSSALELMYDGHRAQGWRLLELGWPEDVPGRERAMADFRSTLGDSPYFAQLPN